MISVVMAAKNYAKYLPMAVESVIAQTYEDWELLIIDDGSNDGTTQAVKPYVCDPRIRYVRSDVLGQSRAKNLGVRLARGAYIAFLDADDAWRPTKLERQLNEMTDEVGVIACERVIIDETILGVEDLAVSDEPLAVSPIDVSRDDIYVANPICFSSVMVRREIFDRVGGFDAGLDLSIDYDLWLRVAAHFRIVTLPEKLVLYRTGHGNLSKRQADRIATAFTIMHRRSDGVSAAANAKAYGMTWQSLAWLYRGQERMRAWQCYTNALQEGYVLSSLKGMMGIIRGRGRDVGAENLSINY